MLRDYCVKRLLCEEVDSQRIVLWLTVRGKRLSARDSDKEVMRYDRKTSGVYGRKGAINSR